MEHNSNLLHSPDIFPFLVRNISINLFGQIDFSYRIIDPDGCALFSANASFFRNGGCFDGLSLRVWRHVVQKGDTKLMPLVVMVMTYDALAMLRLVADDSNKGFIYALDIQKDALDMASSLLNNALNPTEVIFLEVTEIITRSETTLQALEAAERILMPGGLVSLVVYVGHPGGWEELESIEAFAARLSTENWICCKLQMLNRPSSPIPIFLFKR